MTSFSTSDLTSRGEMAEKLAPIKWIADSGASFLMSYMREYISNYQQLKDPISVKISNGTLLKAIGKGSIQTTIGVLDPVYYVPAISDNLFSESYFTRQDPSRKSYIITTDKDKIFMQDNQELSRAHYQPYGIYGLTLWTSTLSYSMISTLQDWHDRLACFAQFNSVHELNWAN